MKLEELIEILPIGLKGEISQTTIEFLEVLILTMECDSLAENVLDKIEENNQVMVVASVVSRETEIAKKLVVIDISKKGKSVMEQLVVSQCIRLYLHKIF